MLKGFVAYSKADYSAVERLMVHLKGLEYENLIEIWHDRQISPGEEWDARIRAELGAADVIIFCVSADLLATDYVQRIEIPKAIARHDRHEATVIPVILGKCAWEGNVLGKLQAIPDRGRTVQDYDTADEVWAMVASSVRKAVRSGHKTPDPNRPIPHERDIFPERDMSPEWGAPPETWVQTPGASPVAFADAGHASDLDRDDFTQTTFAIILHYFEASLENIKAANPNCQTRLRKLSEDAFEAGIYMNGQRLSFCGIFMQSQMGWDGISYSNSGASNRSSMNENLRLAQGKRSALLSWQALMGATHRATEFDTTQMNPDEAASYLWSLFVGQFRP